MKVIAINGSARRDGNTASLIQHVFVPLQEAGIETEMIQLAGQQIRGCTACMQCFAKKDGHCVLTQDPLNEIVRKMVTADGIILGSPTYFADITAELKAVIDRSGMVTRANGGQLRRKVGAGVAVARRGGVMHALQSIQNYFLINEMIIPGSNYWNLAFGRNSGDVETDTEGVATMIRLGENMAWLLDKIAR